MALEEIKEQYAKEKKYHTWRHFIFRASEPSIFGGIDEVAKRYAKAKLEEAAERATIWVETPINGTEFDFVERDLSEACASLNQPPFIERITVFKQSITNTPLD